MPFVRVARDRRGYEHIYLVHTSIRRGRPGRPRILYWFRTPPGVKIGREPFDEQVRRAVEQQYPDLTFDWEKLRVLPPFPPDVERWRERRRAERAAKQARLAETQTDAAAETPSEGFDAEAERLAEVEADRLAEDDETVGRLPDLADGASGPAGAAHASDRDLPAADTSAQAPGLETQPRPAGGRRRRRRGGRHRQAAREGRSPNAQVEPRPAPPAPEGPGESD